MSLAIKKIVFFFFFLLGWLLLLLLGESNLNYILLGEMSLFFSLFIGEVNWKKVNQYRWLGILWVLFLSVVGLSLFFSTNLSLSIHAATRYIFVFLVFWFFLLVKKSFVSSQQIIKFLLLTSLIITLVSVSFQFFPNLTNLLPGTNLLHITHGHNHLAALLLLFIPLSWWLAGKHIKAGRSYWWLLLPLSFTLGLLTSFGRVATVIGLVQLLFIYQRLKQKILINKYQLNIVFKITISLFLIILAGNFFFSMVTLVRPNFFCPVPSLEKQLCKSIEAEFRPRYWRWAVEIIKDHPWLGSGPGTFRIAVKKHRLAFYNSTAYAHNAFLQAGAELGLIGGSLMTALMLSLLYLAWKSLDKKVEWSWQPAAFMGVVAIYVDALFDFDWDFVGILSITVLLLALLIRNKTRKSVKTNFSNFFKIWYVILILVVISLSGLYLATSYLIRSDQVQKAFQFFPYFHWHRKIYETSSDLNDQDRKYLFSIYADHPSIYPIMLSQTKDESQRQQIKERWFEVDPWSVATRDMISYYLEQRDWITARYWFDQISELYSHPVDAGYLDYQQLQLKLDDQGLSLAEGYLEKGNFQSAFDLLSKISEKELRWEKRERAATLQQEIVVRLMSDSDWENLAIALSVIDWSQHDYKWKLELVKNITRAADVAVGEDNCQLASDLLNSAQNLLPGEYWLMIQPANLAVLQGNLESAQQLYQRCSDMYWGSQHDDCYYGLQSIKNGLPNPDRYWQVSKIIRGEAVWQDFVK